MFHVPAPRSPERAFSVLVVCTGNLCRSAMADRLGRAFLDETLGHDAGLVRLESAGTRAVVGSAMHPDSALVLRGFGGEPGDFRARQFEGHMAVEADLVLTMTRGHRRDVLHAAPRALARTFTVREAFDLLQRVDADFVPSGNAFLHRAQELVAALAAARSLRSSSDSDDIRDPIGLPVEVHEEVGEVIVASLLPVLRRIAALRDELPREVLVRQN